MVKDNVALHIKEAKKAKTQEKEDYKNYKNKTQEKEDHKKLENIILYYFIL